MEDHEHHVHLVLEKLQKIDLYTKLEKCEFYQFQVASWVMSSLETALAWILVKFRPLMIGLFQFLFKMSNFFLDLSTFINVSLPTIFQ